MATYAQITNGQIIREAPDPTATGYGPDGAWHDYTNPAEVAAYLADGGWVAVTEPATAKPADTATTYYVREVAPAGVKAVADTKAATSHTHAAGDITSGVLAPARLGTGTPDATRYLRGDGSWQTPPTGSGSGSGLSGTGSPEGAVTATPGTEYIDTAVTNGASSWIKKSGTGNTGWQVLEGDTGWRNVSSLIANGWTIDGGGYIYAKRTSDGVALRALGLNSSSSTSDTFIDLGSNFGTGSGGTYVGISHTVTAPTTDYRISLNTAGALTLGRPVSGSISVRLSIDTNSTASWPTTLPGAAV